MPPDDATTHEKQVPAIPAAGENLDRLYSTKYVADMFSVTKETVRNWIKDGKLKGVRLVDGGPWKVKHSDLIAFANHQHGDQMQRATK